MVGLNRWGSSRSSSPLVLPSHSPTLPCPKTLRSFFMYRASIFPLMKINLPSLTSLSSWDILSIFKETPLPPSSMPIISSSTRACKRTTIDLSSQGLSPSRSRKRSPLLTTSSRHYKMKILGRSELRTNLFNNWSRASQQIKSG